MSKNYGIRSEIIGFPFKDLNESFEENGILVEIHEGLIDISYHSLSRKDEAISIGKNYINAWSLRNNIRLSLNFNHEWNSSGSFHSIVLAETLKLHDRVRTHTVKITMDGVVTNHPTTDSASFINDKVTFAKTVSNPTLARALNYFNNEVVDNDKPLYGIYKALEAITKSLGKNGRIRLAQLVGESKAYVDDVMQTAQTQRHDQSNTNATNKLDDEECRNRAKILIEAYIKSL